MTDLRVTTIEGADAIIEEAAVQSFADSLRGRLLRPGDGGYDEARTVWNGMINRRPALIARCTGVDPVRRTARAEAGLTWGEYNRETQAFGLASTGGVVSTTGIAGLTLGGGLGWLMGKHGLSCDNLLSADLVTAEGKFLTVSPDQHPELFWGLRGGGGNFGVVTSFEYRVHPVGPVLATIWSDASDPGVLLLPPGLSYRSVVRAGVNEIELPVDCIAAK